MIGYAAFLHMAFVSDWSLVTASELLDYPSTGAVLYDRVVPEDLHRCNLRHNPVITISRKYTISQMIKDTTKVLKLKNAYIQRGARAK